MWIKKGLIIEPSKTLWWNQSHGMLPTVQHYKDDEYKVFYSGRDKNNIQPTVEIGDNVMIWSSNHLGHNCKIK